MNSVHDMGGMEGFGEIKRQENEPLFKGNRATPRDIKTLRILKPYMDKVRQGKGAP